MQAATQMESPVLHRIGAVAALSGVAVPTLRGWELRYGAFTPHKTDGQHRLYTDEDIVRATLLKRLTERGHSISRIALLDAAALNTLLQQQKNAQDRREEQSLANKTLYAVAIGQTLVNRLESQQFQMGFSHGKLRVLDIFPDVDMALQAQLRQAAQLLIVRVNTLQSSLVEKIQRLIKKHHYEQVLLLYNFGPEAVVQSLRGMRVRVRREPVSDSDLADFIGSSLLVDTSKAFAAKPSGGSSMIPARKYSDEILNRVAKIDTNMLCECPRHVAEIIAQLASFEQYSQDCLHLSREDAHLHAYLSSVSGSARALFEDALERLAAHEGISLV